MGDARGRRRRHREPRSCLPCRERKVRCDRALPCNVCTQRKHEDLCQYGRPEISQGSTHHAQRTAGAESASPSAFVSPVGCSQLDDATLLASTIVTTAADSQAIRTDHVGSSTQSSFAQSERQRDKTKQELLNAIATSLRDTCNKDPYTGEAVFLGRDSSAAFFRSLVGPASEIELMREGLSVESAFGLNNGTILHPFTSLWSFAGNPSLERILQTLPGAETCLVYFRSYEQNVQPFLPMLLDPEGFETRLCEFVERIGSLGIEAALNQVREENSFCDAAWHAVLFGVLACGCQHSDHAICERIPRARVFVAGAFECLRLANHYGMPSLDTIQALLMIASTISNDSNPGVARGILGSTIVQAKSCGLHMPLPASQTGHGTAHPLWSSIVVLDCTLSCAFDHMPTSFPDTDNSLSLTNLTSIQKPSFWDVMRALHVSKVAWMAAKIDVSRSSNHIQAITLRFLREIQHVKTLIEGELDAWGPSRLIREKLQRFLLKIHVCSFEADILRTSCVYNTENPGVREIHFDAMVINLRTVVKTFLKLRLLAPKAAASWNILHSSMSAALILAGLEKRLASTESFELLGTLRQSLNNTVEPKTDEASYTDTALSRNGLQALYHLQ